MYLAIVLLPLLGAILGGMIALAGARARFPGAEPSDDDHHAAEQADNQAAEQRQKDDRLVHVSPSSD